MVGLKGGWRGSGEVALSRVTEPRVELRPPPVSVSQFTENPCPGKGCKRNRGSKTTELPEEEKPQMSEFTAFH